MVWLLTSLPPQWYEPRQDSLDIHFLKKVSSKEKPEQCLRGNKNPKDLTAHSTQAQGPKILDHLRDNWHQGRGRATGPPGPDAKTVLIRRQEGEALKWKIKG